MNTVDENALKMMDEIAYARSNKQDISSYCSICYKNIGPLKNKGEYYLSHICKKCYDIYLF